MAIRVGYNWTLIQIAQLDYGTINTYAMIREQNTLENKTKYSLMTKYFINSTSYLSFDSARLVLDGNIRDFDYTTLYRSNNDKDPNVLMWLGDREITHETDGTSPIKNVASSWTASFGGGYSANVDIDFPKIKRQAIMASANDFNDEGNPSMSYTYYEGVDFQVNAYLEVNGTRFKTVEDIGNVGTYTFELTTNERNQLRQLCTGQSMTVRYGVATLINSQTENAWSYMDRTMTMVNATPTLTYSVLETNNKVVSMLGGSGANTIISNASNLQFTVTPTTYKYATVNAITLSDGIKSYQDDSSPYVVSFPITSSKDFSIKVKDSRQYETTQTDTARTLLNYLAVAINSYSFKRQNPTSSNIVFNGEFTYWGNVGNHTNTPVVKYKLGEGNWATIPSSSYSIDTTNHKLTINNYTISNILDYRQKGQFSISIEDELTSQEDTSDNGLVLKGVPTFDAGEHDLKVNGKLYIADEDGDNAIDVEEEIKKAGGITYSTSEVKTKNKWIDGKYIYVKAFSFNASGSINWISTGLTTSSISNIWISPMSYAVESGNGNRYNISGGMFNGASDWIYTRLITNSGYWTVDLRADSQNRISYGYIVVEYTKTSD